jgi:CHAT domain-containing protein/tetratricopeptide (TPR) repeat protein
LSRRPRAVTGWLALAAAAACLDRQVPPAGFPADSLFEAGQALYGDEQFDSAHKVWTIALGQARDSSDQENEARLLTELGLAEWRLTRLSQARATQESAIALKQALGLTAGLSRSYNALGLLAHSESRNHAALRAFSEAADAARASGDSLALARALGNRALPARNLGDFAAAREAARGLRAAGRRLGDVRMEANGLSNEAMVDLDVGDARAALRRLDTARQLYGRIVYRTGEQVALGQQSTAWELTGDLDRSFAALDTALTLSRTLGLREDEAINLRLIAGMHARVGDYRRAIRFYEQSATIFRETEASSELGLVFRGEAGAYLKLGNVEHARQSAAEALRRHRESGEGHEELGDLVTLAEVAFLQGGLGETRPLLDSADALAASLGTRGAQIDVALARARLADVAGNSRAVLDVLARTAPALTPGDYGAEWEAAALEARALARTGQLEAAVAAGRRAVAAIERQRAGLPSDALRSTLIADRSRVYGDLVLALLTLGRPGEAFAVADQARSRALLEHLSAVRGESTGTIPRQLAEGEDLLRRIDQLVQRLRENEGRSPRERGSALAGTDTELSTELVAARNEYEAMLVRAARQDPRASALLGVSATPVETVQTALRPGQALLEYLLTANRLIIFVITRDRIRVTQNELDRAALSARVRLLRDLWGTSRSDWRSGLASSRALHRTLIEPVLTPGWLSGISDLLVVPHGILAQLPFAALQNDRTGRFLIQDHTLTHLPSAAVLASAGARPALNVGDAPSAGFAPFPAELPASGPEVAAFTTHTPRAIAHLGADASEPAVRRALAGTGGVHVATHGVLNARNPMFSRIELARPSVGSPENDGRLEVHELLGLTVRSPLVFFSGCETGAGKEWTEDPVLGTADLTLAQAVLAAGAQQVVSTLWRIDDAGAAEFAEQFYRQLSSEPVSGAFALAQRTLAAGGRFGSPYYWAGYVLSGNDNTARRAYAAGSRP